MYRPVFTAPQENIPACLSEKQIYDGTPDPGCPIICFSALFVIAASYPSEIYIFLLLFQPFPMIYNNSHENICDILCYILHSQKLSLSIINNTAAFAGKLLVCSI
ncbi:hypothetical protein P4S93_03700 [Aneurinibacillus thermoaerophilus]|uniref:Uncharacterized protein n=1 Tax=Aneurinibacillus thermoaerophilus TaxID=143495 RepID=A0A1G7X006_ANETH|nr:MULTISPECIES: hypothetical protein [Aneurinibacillus]MED0674026.1 hypothetical protein [Aneurinibacillus thermoaerophilus]MED0678013.1 hypothetical protein [Aneurinibacillus thermoaerophilus]MED0755785.1 hypothetical protein [Aneurinibacillus thermoaerophilus]MED0759886.1 hypothetical protein [Aneurinibacillus thermoaerophilus]MED0764098.1 hypothetical protein [Aneurinibacillus thermoaerophilus]